MNKYRHACESRVAIACQNNRLIIAMLGHGGIDNVKHQRIATGADPSRRLLMPFDISMFFIAAFSLAYPER